MDKKLAVISFLIMALCALENVPVSLEQLQTSWMLRMNECLALLNVSTSQLNVFDFLPMGYALEEVHV